MQSYGPSNLPVTFHLTLSHIADSLPRHVSKGYITFFPLLASLLCCSVFQTQLYWHFGLNNSMLWGTVPGIAECLAASLDSTHKKLVASLQRWKSNMSQTLPNLPWKTKLPLVKNYWVWMKGGVQSSTCLSIYLYHLSNNLLIYIPTAT